MLYPSCGQALTNLAKQFEPTMDQPLIQYLRNVYPCWQPINTRPSHFRHCDANWIGLANNFNNWDHTIHLLQLQTSGLLQLSSPLLSKGNYR